MIDKKWAKTLVGIRQAFRTGIISNEEEERFILYYLFAEKFGWTPEQVDKLSYKEKEVLLELMKVEAEEKKFQLSKMEKKRLI